MKKVKEKWSKMDFDHKVLVVVSLVGIFCILFSLVISYLLGNWQIIADYAAIAWELGCKFFCIGVGALFFVLVLVVLSLIILHLDFQAVLNAIHRLGLAISNKLKEKNVHAFAPLLQYFLYGVLHRNNEFLHLPLGQDFSCLAPRQIAYTDRAGCVFYHFDLITTKQLDMDTDTLRKIVQSYVESELNSYGISGLNLCFISRRMNCQCWSVYIDRITYNELCHRLTFEVLYICTEDSAAYLKKALLRDTAKVEIEREITDDDLQ